MTDPRPAPEPSPIERYLLSIITRLAEVEDYRANVRRARARWKRERTTRPTDDQNHQ